MKAAFAALALIVAPVTLQATAADAQQDPAERARIEELTRRLNGAPPVAPKAEPRTEPRTEPAPAPGPRPRPAAAVASPTSSVPAPSQDAAERARIEELTRRLNGAPPASQSRPPQPQPQRQPARIAEPAPASAPPAVRPSAAAAAPAVPPELAPRPAPAIRPSTPPAAAAQGSRPQAAPPEGLSAAERAALPFRLDLPTGFHLVAGRAAPGAHVYSVRKAGKTYLMIYTGPSSQFPIYDGDQVTAGGRLSIVTTEGPRRIAMEHLFQRSGDPAEIHVWLMAQDGADRDEAERIAQTVDPR